MSYLPYLYLFTCSVVQRILCCVFTLFVLVLYALCCQFLWIFYFVIAPSVFSGVYLTNHC